MTEKRSEYRKRQRKEKNQQIFQNVKTAFSDSKDASEELNVNPDFQRSEEDASHQSASESRESFSREKEGRNQTLSSQEKADRLKKRLNRAIILLTALIVLVLLALFHL